MTARDGTNAGLAGAVEERTVVNGQPVVWAGDGAGTTWRASVTTGEVLSIECDDAEVAALLARSLGL